MTRIISTLLFVLPLVAFAQQVSAQGRGPSMVAIVTAEERVVAPTIELVGTIRPQVRTLVASEVAGLVEELLVDEGDRVSKGQVICKLRGAKLRFSLAEAEARVGEYEALLLQRKAELRAAEFDERRTTNLWELEQCAEKEYIDAKAALDAAKAQVEQAVHMLAAQESIVAILADDLERSEIRAPCDGYIVAKQTEIGQWVSAGAAVFDLLDSSTVRVRVAVPEKNMPYAVVGEEVFVKIDATGESYRGKIARLIPDGDARARTFPVEVDIKNSDGALKAGMFVRAAVPAGPKSKKLLVPKDALVVRGPMSMVYVVQQSDKGQMAIPMPVELGVEVADWIAVTAQGLSAGVPVVVRGNEFLQGPSPVIAMPAGAEQSQAAPPEQQQSITKPTTASQPS